MKKIVTLIILFYIPLLLFAQKYQIIDFKAEIQDTVIVVNFGLLTKSPVDLGMFWKTDSASKWIICKTISGDIEAQTLGRKTIFWDYVKDGVQEEELFNNKLLFRVLEVEPYAYLRELEQKHLQKQKRMEERERLKQKNREESKIANNNPNGHYIGLGTSMISSGYYGDLFGISYEYRYRIYAVNASVGFGYGGANLWGYFPSVNVNTGLKLYMSDKKKVFRNLYFNILPVCYFGQKEKHSIKYVSGDNHNIIRVDDYKYEHLWGIGIFLGYSPVWHINKKVALGFNIDLGVKTNYRFNRWCPVNWDMGFIIKLNP